MARNNRPWMPLYVDDYLRDTMHLTTQEHGAYLLLLMEYWRSGELPTDERKLARIARLWPSQSKAVLAALKPLFGPNWTHKRVNREIARVVDISEKRAESAAQRWNRKNPQNPPEKLPMKRVKPNKNSAEILQLHPEPTIHMSASYEVLMDDGFSNEINGDFLQLHTTHHIVDSNESTTPIDSSFHSESMGDAREARYPPQKVKLSEKERAEFKLEPEKEKAMRKAKNATRIPEDALPLPADRLAAAQRGMSDATIDHEWTQFRTHHVARGTLFANWRAAWLHWVGKWASYGSRQIENAKQKQANYDVDRCRGDGMTVVLRQLREKMDAERNRENPIRDITPDTSDATTVDPFSKLH
jgi:uncharacterized protein YdaU (DUF1376 family)